MISSSQKRRNYSKDYAHQSKLFYHRGHGNSMQLNSYQVWNLLKQRSLNRSLASSQSQQNILRKKPSIPPYRANQPLSNLENKISTFNSKIKNIFRQNEQEGKQNANTNANNSTSNAQFQKTRSAIFKKSQINLKQFMNPGSNNIPYFIQCLKRKSVVSTQTCMHIHNSIMTFKQYLKTVQTMKNRSVDPKIPPEREGRKTIVFDMDQTLIHTSQIMMKGYEIKVPFKSLQGKVISGYVNVRPHAKEIIKNMSKHFDVIIFTAGNQCYADPILDYLDPERKIQHRLYRDSCTMVNNQLFVKDLKILGRKLQNVVLVDNAPYSYMMQLSNGIPILNYLKGKDDDQLIRLESYLMSLLEVEDVRTVNNSTFRISEYMRYDHYDKLINELYGKWF